MTILVQEPLIESSSFLDSSRLPISGQEDEATQSPAPQWRSAPITPGATLLSFDPGVAKEIGVTAAVVLQKVWEWMECNRLNGKMDHFIDGQWYTYNSTREWRDKHFTHLSVATVKSTFRWLEEQGYIQRTQHHIYMGDCRQWVTISAAAKARIDVMSAALPPSMDHLPRGVNNSPRGVQNPPMGVKEHPPTNKNLQIQNHQTKTIKPQTPAAKTPAHESEIETQIDPDTHTAAAAGPIPHPPTANESGEYSINAEVQPPTAEGKDRHGEPALIKAKAKDEPTTPEASPKVAQKGSSALLEELRVDFKMLPVTSVPLVAKHGEDRMRAAMHKTRLKRPENPAGMLITVLRQDDFEPVSDQRLQPLVHKLIHEAPSPTAAAGVQSLSSGLEPYDYDAERIAELEAREHIAPLPEPIGVNDMISDRLTAGRAWELAHHQLSKLNCQLDIWLTDSHLVAYEQGIYRISVSTSQVQNMLQHRYYRNVQRAVEGLSAVPVSIQFEVCPPLLPHQTPLSDVERDELRQLRHDRAAGQTLTSNHTLEFVS